MINYFILAAVVVLIIVLLMKNRSQPQQDTRQALMEKELENLGKTMNNFVTQINHNITALNQQVGTRIDKNTELAQRAQIDVKNTIALLNRQVGELSEANKHVYDLGKDIVSLQEILRAPKLRGVLGEYFLKDMLSQVFPKGRYADQYRFKSGEQVDAVIMLDQLIIPVDSKFPLENFKKMAEAQDQSAKDALQNTFVSDVKKHIDAIAKKYILPDEGTADFALMYIPAENVYYQAMINDVTSRNLLDYAFKKRVIPVSPSSFYAYIQTILIGLRGLEVEEHAKHILANLNQLNNDFGRFATDFELVGTHLGRARNSYESSEKRFDKIANKLTSITQSPEAQVPAGTSADLIQQSEDTQA